MILSLIRNENIYIAFEARPGAYECKSREIKDQITFIVAALEKYKQITFVKSGDHMPVIPKINKHYKINEDSVTIQRSFLKFFKEKLLSIQEGPLTYLSIIKCLS